MMGETGKQNSIFMVPSHSDEAPRLLGGKCSSCGRVFFPKRPSCPRCTNLAIEPVPLSTRGTLETYTAVHQRPLHYEGEVPYLIGKVKLEDGAFILGQLVDCEGESLQIGTEMELIVERAAKDENDNDIFNYKFKPA